MPLLASRGIGIAAAGHYACGMLRLPIDDLLPRITDALRANAGLVLVAAPGAGKTTRVPVALLPVTGDGAIVMLQPRRVAARAAAERIAEENGWGSGEG